MRLGTSGLTSAPCYKQHKRPCTVPKKVIRVHFFHRPSPSNSLLYQNGSTFDTVLTSIKNFPSSPRQHYFESLNALIPLTQPQPRQWTSASHSRPAGLYSPSQASRPTSPYIPPVHHLIRNLYTMANNRQRFVDVFSGIQKELLAHFAEQGMPADAQEWYKRVRVRCFPVSRTA